ncbi:MAG: DUF427 domain-containing protein [Pseudomonadota bacterium]
MSSDPASPSGTTTPQQESVWDYPRPPRLETTGAVLKVVFGGQTIAETTRGYRMLETSHPPVYYIPPDDVVPGALYPESGRSICEFKGAASYWTLAVSGRRSPTAAWSYSSPTPSFAAIRDYLAFYASRVDACFVDGEQVQAQEGDFYGGWITSSIKGPFKGAPGTTWW